MTPQYAHMKRKLQSVTVLIMSIAAPMIVIARQLPEVAKQTQNQRDGGYRVCCCCCSLFGVRRICFPDLEILSLNYVSSVTAVMNVILTIRTLRD